MRGLAGTVAPWGAGWRRLVLAGCMGSVTRNRRAGGVQSGVEPKGLEGVATPHHATQWAPARATSCAFGLIPRTGQREFRNSDWPAGSRGTPSALSGQHTLVLTGDLLGGKVILEQTEETHCH